MMTYFSGEIVCFLVSVGILFHLANNHEVHEGKGNFELDFNLWQITGFRTTLFTFGSSVVFYFINY